MGKELHPIVIDLGSHSMRFGSSQQTAPRVIPSVVGKVIGQDIYSEKPVIEYQSPLTREATNWNTFEDLLDYAVTSELAQRQLLPQNCKVVCTVPWRCPDNGNDNGTDNDEDKPSRRETLRRIVSDQSAKLRQLLTEKYGFKAIYLATDAELSLVASGKPSGVVMQIGHQVTTVLAVIDGEVKAREIVNLGGVDVTNYLEEDLRAARIDLGTPTGQKQAHDFKARHCIALPEAGDGEDVKVEASEKVGAASAENGDDSHKPFPFEFKKNVAVAKRFSKIIPDTVDAAAIVADPAPTPSRYSEAVDILFQPPGEEYVSGIADYIYKVILQVDDIKYHPLLYANIVIAGGTSKIRGLKDRLLSSLYKFAPKNAVVEIKYPFETENSESGYSDNGLPQNSPAVEFPEFVGACKLMEEPYFLTLCNIQAESFVKMRSRRIYRPSVNFASTH